MAEIQIIKGAANGNPSDSLPTMYQKVNTNTANINNQVVNHEGRIGTAEAAVSNHGSRIAEAETELINQDERITNIVASAGDSNTEIVDARQPAAGTAFPILGDRLNNFDAQLAEKTEQIADLDTVKAAKTEVNALATSKAEKTELTAVDTALQTSLATNYNALSAQINAVASGAPDQTFATLAALDAAYPSGNSRNKLVSANGHIYSWNGSAWTDTGILYLSDGTAPESITLKELAPAAVTPEKTTSIQKGINKFNWQAATAGFYVRYTDGQLVANASFYASDYIPVVPGQVWYKNNDQQGAFYDKSFVYTAGHMSGNSVTVPAGAAWMRVTVPNALIYTFQLELGSSATEYELYQEKLINAVPSKTGGYLAIYDGTINIDTVRKELSVTAMNTACVNMENSTRSKKTLAFNATATTIDISTLLNGVGFLFNIIGITRPSNALEVKFRSYGDALEDNAYIIGTYDKRTNILVSANKAHITVNGYPQTDNILDITLKTDGTGHFTTLKAALAYANDATVKRQYRIHVYEGDHDVFGGYTTEEIQATSFPGPKLKDYVHIIGEGDYRKIRLLGRLSAALDTATKNRVSPINLSSINSIENVTIIGQNTRYAIHDDANTVGLKAKRLYKDVYCYKETGAGLPMAYGAGCRSGAYYEFDNFIAVSDMGTPFSLHNGLNFADKCRFLLKHVQCHNRGMADGTTPRQKFSMDFPCEMSNTADEITMIGCYIPDGIYVWADMSAFGTNTTGQIDFAINGYGNTIGPSLLEYTDGKEYFIDFNEEVSRHYASAAITKGQPLKYSQRGKVAPMASGDNAVLFIGVALTSAAAGQEVVMRVKGYLQRNDTPLSSVSVGDKIGITGGELAVVTSGDYVGRCVVADYVLMN